MVDMAHQSANPLSSPLPLSSGPCSWNLTGPDGTLASPLPSSIPYEGGPLECIYTITVYPGYGVEIRVSVWTLENAEGGSQDRLRRNQY